MPTSTAIPNKYSIPFLLVLIAAGLAGNYFNFEMFLNIYFLFGSIFAMLALQFFGIGRGVLAATVIASYTYILWNHPYAIIIQSTEVAAVGWLMSRRKIGMVLADTLYWLIIGMPLVYLFYHFAMHVPPSNTYIVMIKQTVNGIANALVARLIFTAYTLRSRSSLTSYGETVYNLLAFFVLCPTLIMLAVGSRSDFNQTDHQIRTALMEDNQRVVLSLKSWVENRKSAIINLAEMSASRSPQQMQPYLELAGKSDVNLQRIGLHNKEATTTAYFPLIDELGQNNIGRSFADRPFIPRLKQTLKPMLSEVVMGKVGIHKPKVMMLAPVVMRGEYGGYIAGVLSLQQIQDYLDKSGDLSKSLYTLLDNNGNVIMSNRTDQTVMKPLMRGKGTLNSLDKGISQWVPALPPNTPVSEQWKKSFYVTESTVGDLIEWKLILEQPVAPFQKRLYDEYTGKLALLFLILLISLALAELLSRKIVVTLARLRTLTFELPGRLATAGNSLVWPESGFKEAHHLITNFREMANSLSGQFIEIQQINENLERRVEERTSSLIATNSDLIAEIAERKQAEENLRKSKELYHSLVETSQDLIWQCDTEGRYTYLNLAWEQVFGYELDEMIGNKFSDFQTFEDAALGLREHDRLMEGNSVKSFEATHIGKSGNKIYLVFNALFISDETGNIVGTSGTAYDITNRKLLEEELHKAKAAAESANLAKSEFLANMSHEIRTPMNGVLGMTQLLAMTDLTEEQQSYISTLNISGRNLLTLINDILDLSKVESGKIELELTEFSINQCITDLVLMQKSILYEKELKLNVDIADDIPPILVGDQLRIKQILLNLLGNAVKFTKQGTITITAHILELYDSSVILQISVSDTGIGIPQDALDKIFMPFVQADGSTTRKYGGTGLGLSISLRLTEMMGGSIAVESTPDVGTCFTVTLPLKFIHKVDKSVKEQLPHICISDGPRLRILYAEDDPTNNLFGKLLLKKLGHDVAVAENGRECLEILDQTEFDLLLMDIQMPVMNGEDALYEIRKKEQETGFYLPVIALTAFSMRADIEHYLEVGFDGYVSKPLSINELVSEMKRVMDKFEELGGNREETL